MKSEKEKSGRFLIIAIFFLLLISSAQGAWDNDDLMYAKGTSGGQLTVHNIDTAENFTTIQDAIDDPDTKDGHTISVDAGIYPKPGISPKPIVINKQLKLIGENNETTIIDGDGSGNCIQVTADNVEICGFTIKNGDYGIYLESSNCRVIDNNITSIDFDGIFLRSNSVNNTIAHNSISKVERRGIRLSSSSNNRIHDNDLSGNDEGIVLFASQDNSIYHNNFIDNRIQAKDNRDTNRWDKGREEGGNYWSDYKCTGNPSDGSQPYKISVGGAKDTYPFMDKDGWTCTLPSPPRLADPGTNDNDGNYTVSWSSVSSATNYTLEEDTNDSFSSPTMVYSVSETSKEITGKSDGTYYYQVKARNECGWSDWSNKENITIDSIPPTVTISYPTSEQMFNTTNITVNGTASDDVKVSKVEVEVEPGSWQTASGTTLWNTSVTLVPGSNTINASVTDTAGNIKNTSVTVICDIAPPVIYHETITTATGEESILISATITDNTTKVASATLFYRIRDSEEAEISTPMDHSGDNYSATIPASHVTTAGVEYYIEAVDDVLNTAHSPATAPTTPYSITVIGESRVTISAVPSTINLSESVNISGKITRAHSANVTLTFTTPNGSIQKNSTTSTPNGSYYFVFKPEEVGNWTVNATWAGDSGTAGNTSKTVSFTVIGDESRVTISVIPSTINLSESVNISGIFTRAHSANVTLTFTTPNNATQKNSTTSTPNGSYYFVFRPEEVGNWTVNATWAGDSGTAGNTSKTVSFTVNVSYAIIIVGRHDDNRSQLYIDHTANEVYRILTEELGFTNKSIFYLNPRMEYDAQDDGVYEVDNISSLMNVSYAINTWTNNKASVDVPLLIYMVDHGTTDAFLVNGDKDTLNASDLNNSLNLLTNATKCYNITIVIDAGKSGSFINELSYDGRIIVTSAGLDTDAFIDTEGAHFSLDFFNSLSNGKTIKDAFENASNNKHLIKWGIKPLLDDNGDGKGHNISRICREGPLAESTYIGRHGGARGVALTNGHSYNNRIPAIRLEGV